MGVCLSGAGSDLIDARLLPVAGVPENIVTARTGYSPGGRIAPGEVLTVHQKAFGEKLPDLLINGSPTLPTAGLLSSSR